MVLRASGGNSILGELSNECVAVAMEDALRLNVCAVAAQVYIGSEFEHQSINNIIKLVDAGARYGMPTLAVTGVGKEMARDARYFSLASRIAAEMGAQFVKTYYVDEGFEKVTASCPVPIVIAGGKAAGARGAGDVLARDRSGCVRRGHGAQYLPVQRAARDAEGSEKVVHEDMSARDAFQFWQEEKQGEAK